MRLADEKPQVHGLGFFKSHSILTGAIFLRSWRRPCLACLVAIDHAFKRPGVLAFAQTLRRGDDHALWRHGPLHACIVAQKATRRDLACPQPWVLAMVERSVGFASLTAQRFLPRVVKARRPSFGPPSFQQHDPSMDAPLPVANRS